MMGNKKLSTIREELREALERVGTNPIAELDRKICKLQKNSDSLERDSRSLLLLRNALAQVVEEQPRERQIAPRSKSKKKTLKTKD